MKSKNHNKLNFLIKFLILNLLILKPFFSHSETVNVRSNFEKNKNIFYKVEFIFGKENNMSTFLLSGLKINLKPGWKIYWKNPGDAGLPPKLNWKKVNNIKNVEFLFPSPKRFNFFGIDTFGYEREIVFPIKIFRNNKNNTVKGFLEFNAQICEKICIPIKKTIFINSELNKNRAYDYTNKIKSYLSLVPFKNEEENLYFKKIFISDGQIKFVFNKNVKSDVLDLIVEDDSSKILPLPTFYYSIDDEKIASVNIKNLYEKELVKKAFKVTLLSDELNFYQEISLSSNIGHKKDILYILIISFIAGVILNFMPCVLPILSLKIANFLSMNELNSSVIKKKVFYQIIGIVISFFILFLITSTLKFLGNQFMWGEQFQNQYFLLFMTIIIMFFGINLIGFFEIKLPHQIIYLINKFNLKSFEDFFSGFLMTALSTPCSAPFVGTAVMFALSGGYSNIFFIFFFMSLGLAFPLILIFVYPNSLKFLPKTGNWLFTFKKIMGLLFIISGLWIFSIFINNFSEAKFDDTKHNSLNWTNWDIEKNSKLIKKLIDDEKIVLLDITADWCITCKYNKWFVLNNENILKLIKDNKIITLQMDWTKKDKNIENFILSKNRYGIPYNEIYSKKFINGIIFPELLDEKTVIEYINKAK